MVFSSPSILWALGLLAIPIIIHLFEFRRYKKLYFSDTSLFKEIKSQSQTKNQLRHLLLLIARLLFLTFLILAFAEPMVPASSGKKSEPEVVSIYIDNSYSMSSSDEGGSKLLAQALEMAFRISEQYPKGYKFQLITNRLSANEKRLLNKEELLEQLDLTNTIAQHRLLEEILLFQERSLAENDIKRSLVYCISDFNQTLPKGETQIEIDSLKMLRLVPLRPVVIENLSIDSAWSDAPIIQKGIEQKIGFRVTNHGSEEILDQKIDVYINERQVFSPIISINANAYLDTSFSFVPEQNGSIHGRISLDDRSITFDDTYYFTLPVKSSISIAEINETIGISSPFKRLFSSEQFSHIEQESSALLQDELNETSLLVFNELTTWNSGLTAIAESHLKKVVTS